MTRLLTTSFILVLIGTSAAIGEDEPPPSIARAFEPPEEFRGDLGRYRSPLIFDDGRVARNEAAWRDRRREILDDWFERIGAWPPFIEKPEIQVLGTERREDFTQERVRVRVDPDRSIEGYLLVPDGPGSFPAVLVVFYEPETAIGRGKPGRDFALELVRRGFVALSIGMQPLELAPGHGYPEIQPLSYLAYVAANAGNALASRPEVLPDRIGIVGHSYGGKWAMFAACLNEKFACAVWSDPGIVFDESRPNVNYWEPWYLGWEEGKSRARGPLAPGEPRLGAYRQLVEEGRDLHELHALMAPRPFLVSGGAEDQPERWRALNHAVAVNELLGQRNRVAMTNRSGHDPTEESNEQICRFLEYVLKPGPLPEDARP